VTEELKCPACSGRLPIEDRFTRTIACPYCGQVSHVLQSGAQPASGGGVSLAQFPSIFAPGKVVTWNDREFTTLGRVRFQYDQGFWDEWCVGDGSGERIWIEEDEGRLTEFAGVTLSTPVPDFWTLRVGTRIEVNSEELFISELGEAVVAGCEGELPVVLSPGQGLLYVDGLFEGRRVSLEYWDLRIELSVGNVIDRDRLKIV
jgi:Domain of unknown function (DUF4178)